MLRVSSGLGQKFRGSKSQHVLDQLWRNRLMARCSVKSRTWDIWQTKYILEVAHSVGLWAIWNAEEVILCPFLWVRIWAGRPSHQVWVGRGSRGEMIISFQDIPDVGSSKRKTFCLSDFPNHSVILLLADICEHMLSKYSWYSFAKYLLALSSHSYLNKVTTRWEGPQSLSYHKQWLGKDGLLYIQTCTSKQSYTARVRVDCAV